jgi:hypothetical protein
MFSVASTQTSGESEVFLKMLYAIPMENPPAAGMSGKTEAITHIGIAQDVYPEFGLSAESLAAMLKKHGGVTRKLVSKEISQSRNFREKLPGPTKRYLSSS